MKEYFSIIKIKDIKSIESLKEYILIQQAQDGTLQLFGSWNDIKEAQYAAQIFGGIIISKYTIARSEGQQSHGTAASITECEKIIDNTEKNKTSIEWQDRTHTPNKEETRQREGREEEQEHKQKDRRRVRETIKHRLNRQDSIVTNRQEN